MILTLAQTEEAAESAAPLISTDLGVLAVLLAVLASLFWFNSTKAGNKFFSIVPMLVFCYFVPTTLTTLGLLPDDSPVYAWIKTYLLPASLVLLILALDLPGIVRLGPKAVIMLLAGTAGVVIGGPIAFFIMGAVLPESAALPDDTWQGLTALSGSWIGGGANFVALGQIAGATDGALLTMLQGGGDGAEEAPPAVSGNATEPLTAEVS